MKKFAIVIAAAALAATSASAGLIEKGPDLGAFWQPLNSSSGSYVYANTFVADMDGTVDSIGTWLLDMSGGGTGADVEFMVLGSLLGAPDPNNVIASTGMEDIGGGTSTLDLYDIGTDFSGAVTAGETYFFAVSVIGGGGTGSYQVGGHTQNSVYLDDGTFWFSNDPTGQNFDGAAFTPEMAFRVNIIPAPAALALFGCALVGTRRRRA